MKTRHLLLFLLLGQTTGCYTYIATPLQAVPERAEVRVEVTRETAARLSDALVADRTSIEGRVRAHEDGDILLDVVTASRQVGFQFEPLRQTIRLSPADATFVQRKVLDRGRTAVVVGVAGLAAGAIAWEALGGNAGGAKHPPDTGQPADSKVARFFLRIPFP